MSTKEQIQAKIDQNIVDRQAVITEGENLQRELAACDKPKLRHGDYGCYEKSTGADNIWLMDNEKTLRPFNRESMCSCLGVDTEERAYGAFIKFGNIFDDLQELGKPIDIVTVDDGANGTATVKIHTDGIILSCTRSVWFKDGQFDKFIMDSRRLSLKAKQK